MAKNGGVGQRKRRRPYKIDVAHMKSTSPLQNRRHPYNINVTLNLFQGLLCLSNAGFNRNMDLGTTATEGEPSSG
jgi:hypothetical protein